MQYELSIRAKVMQWKKVVSAVLGILIFAMTRYTLLKTHSVDDTHILDDMITDAVNITVIYYSKYARKAVTGQTSSLSRTEPGNHLTVQLHDETTDLPRTESENIMQDGSTSLTRTSQPWNIQSQYVTKSAASAPQDNRKSLHYVTVLINFTESRSKERQLTSINTHRIVEHSTGRHTEVPKSTASYVLAANYWEQQTSGSRNLQNLQCWAGQWNAQVVEPFFDGSVITSPLVPTQSDRVMRFGDLFDLAAWNEHSRKLKYSELVSWDTFLHEAPRQVIIVRFIHERWDQVQLLRKKVSENPSRYLPSSERYKLGCETTWPNKNTYSFFQQNKFLVVREVCFNFRYGDHLTNKQFVRDVYGEFSPSSVTVAFRTWRGMGSSPRILVSDSSCRDTKLQLYIQPSIRLAHDAQKYIDTYLGNTDYIAIMARMEKSKITLHRPGTIHYCFEKIIKYWMDMKQHTMINKTFLSIDIGRYGSNSFRNTGDATDLKTEFKNFLLRLYGGSLTAQDWENTFENVTGTNHAGYIALLQMTVFSRAKCMIMTGGGSFQTHAMNLYMSNHPVQAEQCVSTITECTSRKA